MIDVPNTDQMQPAIDNESVGQRPPIVSPNIILQYLKLPMPAEASPTTPAIANSKRAEVIADSGSRGIPMDIDRQPEGSETTKTTKPNTEPTITNASVDNGTDQPSSEKQARPPHSMQDSRREKKEHTRKPRQQSNRTNRDGKGRDGAAKDSHGPTQRNTHAQKRSKGEEPASVVLDGSKNDSKVASADEPRSDAIEQPKPQAEKPEEDAEGLPAATSSRQKGARQDKNIEQPKLQTEKLRENEEEPRTSSKRKSGRDDKEELMKREIAKLRDQLSTQVRTSKAQIRRLEITISQNDSLLQTRALELEAAQAFLSTGDKTSFGEVVKMMQTLNEEIFQLASFLSNEVTIPERSQFPVLYTPSVDKTKETVGPVLFEFLSSTLNTMYFQFAFQAVMTTGCRELIRMWSFSSFEADKAMRECYKAIRTRESQSVSGKWRAIAHTRVNLEGDSPFLTHSSHFLSKAVMGVFIAMGCIGEPMKYLSANLQNTYVDRIGILVKHAARIRDAIFCDITSSDITPAIVKPGVPFDDGSMTDMYAEETRKTPGDDDGIGNVACAIELGLHVAKKVQGDSVWEESWLLKPKVILEELLPTL